MRQQNHLRARRVLVWGILLTLHAPGLFCSQTGGNNDKRGTPSTSSPSVAEVSRAIDLAVDYLQHACSPDGRFVYRVDFQTNAESDSYNIIRHAGAIYALGMAEDDRHDPQIVALMARASAYLRQNYIGPGPIPGEHVVWSRPLAERVPGRYHEAELGGSSLGLVALAALERAKPKSVPLEELESLGLFLLSLQREDGSFVNKYRVETGPVANWESLYYPGEAALAYVALYEADHSPEWLKAAEKALSYLARSRVGLSTVPADHWALIATAKLFLYCDRETCPVSRDKLLQHAVQICNSMLLDEVKNSDNPALIGAFDDTGRTTPTATRLEGLLAALEFLPDGELRTKIEAAVQRGVAFLLRAQISSGPYAGGMPGAFGTVTRDVTNIRIDYVQHALSAWLRYQKLFQRAAQLRHDTPATQEKPQS